MKVSGRNLGRRLLLLGDRISRIKHRKGHGVHSPFVYSLVRKVFMNRKLAEGTGSVLYDLLRFEGVAERSARQLHNLMFHLGAKSFSIDRVEGDLSILLSNYPTEALALALEEAERDGLTLAVCHPYSSRERQNAVAAMVASHRSTTVDNRAYILFFNNHLPKQYYRL